MDKVQEQEYEKFVGTDSPLVKKWGRALKGIEDAYTRKVTAILLENQAKAIVAEKLKLDEDNSAATTTVGKLGTFQKFAFPIVRRTFPELIANSLVSVQPMQGPVGQVFYFGSSRQYGTTEQVIYSKYLLTYRGMVTSGINAGGSIDLDTSANPSLSSIFGAPNSTGAFASATLGGQIASWPNAATILGWDVSAGENLAGTGIPEVNIHIESQPVVARTRKMRALWTVEANQDLKAYHNLDLEKELTTLMQTELKLEMDREIIEDLRMIAYDPLSTAKNMGGWFRQSLDNRNSNDFKTTGGQGPDLADFVPGNWLYNFANIPGNPSGTSTNVWLIDFTSTALPFAPQHVGHVYANLLGVVNFMSQDIYKTTHKSPGSWILTSPIVGAMLETASKLEGGMQDAHAPTNMSGNQISYKGKFAGKYDLYIDPLYPEDELLMGRKGEGPMDAGYCYCPYIPLELFPTIPDPETFQPRKGVMTRYGKLAITPESRHYRILRIVGPNPNYLFQPFGKAVQQFPIATI